MKAFTVAFAPATRLAIIIVTLVVLSLGHHVARGIRVCVRFRRTKRVTCLETRMPIPSERS